MHYYRCIGCLATVHSHAVCSHLNQMLHTDAGLSAHALTLLQTNVTGLSVKADDAMLVIHICVRQ